MADEELVPRDEARAALAARRELGEEFDDALVESFARRIEQRLAAQKSKPAKRTRTEDERGASFVLAIVSLGTGIPITAIAVAAEGLAGLVVVWAGIVLLNVLFARLR
jgi:hypothetical protein